MTPSRRAVLLAAAAAAVAAPARALDADEARSFVRDAADELLTIIRDDLSGADRTEAFLEFFRRTAALRDIARFVMGLNWREMSEAQREAYYQAFERYAARTYANNVEGYAGQELDVVGTQDAGRRGVVVNTILRQPAGEDLKLDWLVSDRGGRTEIVDLIAEGVSVAISQREEFSAMVERRGGDIDQFIADLKNGATDS